MNLLPFIILFGPGILSLASLALGISLARSRNAHRSWGVLAGALLLIQGFLMVGLLLFLGTSGRSLIAIAKGSPEFCAAVVLWLGCLVARIAYLRRERRRFGNHREERQS